MSINLLAICVGNTRTRIGAFTDDKLTLSQAVENNADLTGAIRQAWATVRELPGAAVLLSSVNPEVSDRLLRSLSGELPGVPGVPVVPGVKVVEKDVPIPIGRQLDRETIVGDDRLLAAAAAFDTLKQACVVVDAGTAVTVDFVDGAGTFHGGAIAPGAKMMLDSLHTGTALLPGVTMARPTEPIGHNTVEAMRVAVFHGLRGLVRELVEQYAQVAGAFPLVVATGGDAELLFEGFDLIDRLVPDLTLLGMAATWRAAVEEDR